jgi:hypothetical protein
VQAASYKEPGQNVMYAQVNDSFHQKAFPKRVEQIMNNNKRWVGKVKGNFVV